MESSYKQVLTKDHVQLYSLELCNAGKYPIFHVNFKYDPMGLTDSFFLPFYNAMLSANGRNPMAFVDAADNETVLIGNDRGKLKRYHEQYTP